MEHKNHSSEGRGAISVDKTTVIEIVKKYAEIVKDNFPVKMVILYGSYAKETAREDSDIDIAIVVDSIEGDILESGAKLFRLCRDFDAIMEPVLIEEKNDPGGFLEEILKTGEIIYKNEQLG